MGAGPTSLQIERAWHILTVIVRLGRPASPEELSSLDFAEPPVSPELLRFLCSLPGSPLAVTASGHVVASGSALSAMGAFVVRLMEMAVPVPGALISLAGQRGPPMSVSATYSRKRKVGIQADCFLPSKRMLLPYSGQGELSVHAVGKSSKNSMPEAMHIEGLSGKDALSIDMSILGCYCSTTNHASALPSYLNTSSIAFSDFSLKNPGQVLESKTKKVCKNNKPIMAQEALPEPPGYNNGNINDTDKQVAIPKLKIYKTEEKQAAYHGWTGTSILEQASDKKHDSSCLLLQSTVEHGMLSTRKDIAPLGHEPSEGHFSLALCSPGFIKTLEIAVANEGEANSSGGKRRDHELENSVHKELKPEYTSVPSPFQPVLASKQQRNSLLKPRNTRGFTADQGLQRSLERSNDGEENNHPKQEQNKRDKHVMTLPKSKRNNDHTVPTKEKGAHHAVIPQKDSTFKSPKSDLKPFPNFDSFSVEEEEGSGGYGIVYRARRKKDGQIFAVKCPHANAHLHHVHNELKMLERFGGRNFIIRYEGSFKSGESECFVLEHVEHDRPEVLKKEISNFELQWYGYCLFRALASLHKQGVVHRDIKPGNFLFSRKLNKGYLIDFNLATDLHNKYCRNGKPYASKQINLDSAATLYNQSINDVKKDAIQIPDPLNDQKGSLIAMKLKKRSTKDHTEKCMVDYQKKCGNQPADVSGITSAKEATSTRTSGDRLKQLMPSKGRKELINLAHEVLQNPNYRMASAPASHRKRVAAPMAKVDKKFLAFTPMPLHCGGDAVGGAGMSKSKESGKQKREGPCMGTKGYRAPEVLFKSYHQGCKIDIWSAGVTLLYLIIGRTPFFGDPEQNVREIAKLRGSEDLWEVAKLHNCELSFPMDLLDLKWLQTMKLRDWCEVNTKRPDFLELIPFSLFDLIDKCLTVNPRARITAEEALMHEFFKPCHESLRKLRLQRKASSSDSESQHQDLQK